MATLQEIEAALSSVPKAVAGAETRIADGLRSVLGVGEEVANLTGLNHVAGIFQKVATGSDSVLAAIDQGEQVISHIGTAAENVTPAALAAIIIPESTPILQALQKAGDLASRFDLGQELKTLILHNINLVNDADIALRALETGGDALVSLPFIHFSGTITAVVVGANAFLHWLEPKLADAIIAAKSAAP